MSKDFRGASMYAELQRSNLRFSYRSIKLKFKKSWKSFCLFKFY